MTYVLSETNVGLTPHKLFATDSPITLQMLQKFSHQLLRKHLKMRAGFIL